MATWNIEVPGLVMGPGTPYHILGVEGLGPSAEAPSQPRTFRRGSLLGVGRYAERDITIRLLVRPGDGTSAATNWGILQRQWTMLTNCEMKLEFPHGRGNFPLYAVGRPSKAGYGDLRRLKGGTVEASLTFRDTEGCLLGAQVSRSTALVEAGSGSATWPWVWPVSWGPEGTGTLTLENNGDLPAYLTVLIKGPIVAPVITTASGQMGIATSLAAPEVLRVYGDTARVLGPTMSSIRHLVTPGSMWPVIPRGNSPITVTGDVSPGAAVTVQYRPAYNL